MPESIKLSIGSLNRIKERKARSMVKKITYDDAKQAILAKNYASHITEGLLKKLGTYPDNTYRKFLMDIFKHIKELQNKEKDTHS